MIQINSKICNTVHANKFLYSNNKKRKFLNVHQRIKMFNKKLDKYKRITLIRPPNLK